MCQNNKEFTMIVLTYEEWLEILRNRREFGRDED